MVFDVSKGLRQKAPIGLTKRPVPTDDLMKEGLGLDATKCIKGIGGPNQ